jgi:3-oxoacyl-[acyl-carrier-protein] synthase-3
MNEIRIHETGSYVLAELLNNDDLQAMVLDTLDEWIFSGTGVRERRIAAPDVCTSDIAYQACFNADLEFGIGPTDGGLGITPFNPPGEPAVRSIGRRRGSDRDSNREGDLFG